MNPDLCVLVNCCGEQVLLCFSVNPGESPEDFARRVVRTVQAFLAACEENCESGGATGAVSVTGEESAQQAIDLVKQALGL